MTSLTYSRRWTSGEQRRRQRLDDALDPLGDHRDRSNDSRALGTIPIERVKGRVLSIYWSSEGGAAGCASIDGLRTQRLFRGVD